MFNEETLHRYGTPLEPLHEEDVPAKKAVFVEDQIVTDENGKRRFHGAFTGGFSAGFWNTVGSLEGWTPQSFKSSRAEKAEQRQQQRPEDFMDAEDKGEFGIAPQRIQTRDDFGKDLADERRKRKFMQPSMSQGPIPGAPVLQQLLKPTADKVAVRILKSMGWRPGQGVGKRQTRKEKKRTKAHNQRELYLVQHYGAELTKTNVQTTDTEDDDDDDDDDSDDEVTFAPDDWNVSFCEAKNNRYGLGYTGLSREPVLGKGTAPAQQHINLFGPLELLDKNNKKLSITGQAFGVGALEEEDDDIYARDDMSKYDFSLADKKPKQVKAAKHVQNLAIIDGFHEAQNKEQLNQTYTVDLPRDFKPRNWAIRKSRFTPLDPAKAKELQVIEKDFLKCSLGRHEMQPHQRGSMLGELNQLAEESNKDTPTQHKPSIQQMQAMYKSREERTKELLERISAKSCNFTRGGIITTEGEEHSEAAQKGAEQEQANLQQEAQDLLAKASNKTKNLASSTSAVFKPFLGDDAKQNRYDQFIAADLKAEDEITTFLSNIQPVHLSEWDREMEKKEFIQARSIYKPLGGMMSDRFVSAAMVVVEKKAETTTLKNEEEEKVTIERTKSMWKPSALLCKRYNIAEPFGGAMIEEKQQRKSKLSVFDYLETSVHTKANFQTPVIIPKHIEKPKAIIKDTERAERVSSIENSKLQTMQDEQNADKLRRTDKSDTIAAAATATITATKDYVPKNDLEKRVVESRDLPASEKTELFKSIFEDSDDDEEHIASNSMENIDKESIIDLPVSLKPTSAAAANLLRNTSPPRGIFAALFTNIDKQEVATPSSSKIAETSNVEISNKALETSNTKAKETPLKIAFKSRSERLREEIETSELPSSSADIYGPQIPTHIKKFNNDKPTTSQAKPTATDVDEKLLKLLEKQKTIVVQEQWVEKKQTQSSDDSIDDDDDDSSSSSDSSAHKHKKKSKKSKSKRKHKERDSSKHKKKLKKKSKKHEKTHKSKKKSKR